MTLMNQVPLTKPVSVGARGTNGFSMRKRKSFLNDSLAEQLFEDSTDGDLAGRNKPSLGLTLPSLTDDLLQPRDEFLKRGCPKILDMAHKRRQ